MKRIFTLLFCVLLTFALTGCLDDEKLIKLNPDGSGTIEETTMMSREAIQQLEEMTKAMQEGMGMPGAGEAANASKGAAKPFDLLDEAKLKKQAAQMGEGVALASTQRLETPKAKGYKAVFTFKDINKVKLDQNPASSAPSPGGMESMGTPQDSEKAEPITFRFTKGSGAPSELTITMPEPKFSQKEKKDGEEKDAAAAKPEADSAEMAQMQAMLKDMRVRIAVETKGAITKTNAAHREGSQVILLEMDFNKLLADPAKFKEFAQADPDSLEEAKKILKDIPGVKVETARQVSVQFQ